MDQNNDDRGIDLSHALGDSGSRIKLKDEQFQRYRQSFQTTTPKSIKFIIKYSGGYIKDEKQASFVLLGFVAVAIVVSLFLFFGAVRSPSPPPSDQIIKVAGPEGKR